MAQPHSRSILEAAPFTAKRASQSTITDLAPSRSRGQASGIDSAGTAPCSPIPGVHGRPSHTSHPFRWFTGDRRTPATHSGSSRETVAHQPPIPVVHGRPSHTSHPFRWFTGDRRTPATHSGSSRETVAHQPPIPVFTEEVTRRRFGRNLRCVREGVQESVSDVLKELRARLRACSLLLEVPGVAAARAARDETDAQIADYLLPRLERLDAPLLVVVGGSTGAGKSTLVNSLVGAEVSPAGVLRPTTRAPVL